MAEHGTGTTIVFGTSGFSASWTAVNQQGISRGFDQTSHLGSTNNHTYKPKKLVDQGEVPGEFFFDPTEQPPINGEPESITITFPDGSTAVFVGFLTGWEWGAPLEELMTGSATLKISGGVTWTDAA